MTQIEKKREKRNSRLLELGLGNKTELIDHISEKFITDIVDRINDDLRFQHKTQNKKAFNEILIKNSNEYVKNFICSFDKETLQKFLIEFNKLEN